MTNKIPANRDLAVLLPATLSSLLVAIGTALILWTTLQIGRYPGAHPGWFLCFAGMIVMSIPLGLVYARNASTEDAKRSDNLKMLCMIFVAVGAFPGLTLFGNYGQALGSFLPVSLGFSLTITFLATAILLIAGWFQRTGPSPV